MRIITWRVLKIFGEKHPAAISPLRAWFRITQIARWRNFADVKATFGQTDQPKVNSGQMVCVFDVGGNKFRLVAYVSYAKGKVYVLRMMTHKDYDKGSQQWKQDL